MIKEALQFITDMKEDAMSPQIVEIDGKTYCNKSLHRYDEKPRARAITVNTLTSLLDYIYQRSAELPGEMILHVVSPDAVKFYSGLDEEREREYLISANAELPQHNFDSWTDQERFIIDLQANFVPNDGLALIQRVAGTVEAKTVATYGDDGVSQKATVQKGIAGKEDVVAPNPVNLIPYRTFLEVKQPASNFVFRISEHREQPVFKLIEAEGGMWKLEAMQHIKNYLAEKLADCPVKDQITII